MPTQASSAAPLRDGASVSVFSQDEIEAFKRSFAEKGYLVFKGVVPKEPLTALVAKILEELEIARRSSKLFSGGGLISGHLNSFPGEDSRFIYQTLQQRGIVQVIQAIHPRPFGAPYPGCNLNFPKSVAQHYHVDGLYLKDFIIANIGAVDTDLANGAIDLLPGSHQKFYPYWRFLLERVERRSMRVSMQPGDVLLRTSNLWHRGMPNRTSAIRPMFSLTFDEDRGPPPPDPFRLAEGKITFTPNWYRPDLLGRLRERMFVTAPITYDIYRLARSLYGNKGYASW